MLEKEIMKLMDNISNGVPNENNEDLLMLLDEDEVYWKHYYLQTPEELLVSKLGVCYDQVELERKYFNDYNIKVKTYFICTYDGDNIPSHTFLTFEKDNKFYWFEHTWKSESGIHEYSSEQELLLSVKEKFINSHETNREAPTKIYEYQPPKPHINCKEYYEYMETQKLIEI